MIFRNKTFSYNSIDAYRNALVSCAIVACNYCMQLLHATCCNKAGIPIDDYNAIIMMFEFLGACPADCGRMM